MPAYVIADTTPVDTDRFDQYRPLAASAIEKYGGRYLARGGVVDGVEGGWEPDFLVIVEFPSLERARRVVSLTRVRRRTRVP